MEKRTAMHLRAHLSVFKAGYPIQKGYVARLLIADSHAVPSVIKEVKNIIEMNEMGKHLHEGTLSNKLHAFRKLIQKKKCRLTKEWPSLITLFLEPFPITFRRLPVVPVSSQSVDTSIPSPTRHPEPSTSPASEVRLEPDIPVILTLIQPVQNSTTNNSPSCLMTCKLPSPRKYKSYCASCVNKQRIIMNVMQKNTLLHQQCREFKMFSKGKKGIFSLKRYNEKIKRKTQSVAKWEIRYVSLSEACRNTHKLLKLVESLEQQVKTLEGKLTAAQKENINMASVNERLESMLKKTENKNFHFKQVHEKLKSILEKTEDDDADLNLLNIAKAANPLMMPLGYSQTSHTPEMEIKEESPWEAADNCGDNFALQNDEIKQDIFEEHPERSHSKETSASNDSTAISKDVTSNVPMTDKLSGERCQVKAQHDCLDHGPPIYIDNAEALCEQFSNEDENQMITAEGKVDHPNLYSENEATSLYPQLCYVNSLTAHTENGTHQ